MYRACKKKWSGELSHVSLAFLLGWLFGPSRSQGPALGELTSSSHSCLVLTPTSSSGLGPPSRLVVGSS